MSEFKETGKVLAIREVEQISDSFKKRNIWIETQDQYPQTLEFQFVQDKVSVLDSYKKDDIVEISFNLRGRGYKNKEGKAMVFNTLQGWRIGKADSQEEQASNEPVKATSDDDGLPF